MRRLRPSLELVELPLGHVVYESGRILDHLYFPTDCIVSILYVMEDGARPEIAVVGNEGVVGISLFMGGETTPSRAVVQSAGERLPAPARSCTRSSTAAEACSTCCCATRSRSSRRWTQTAVCNRHHSVDQQLCRWLLSAWTACGRRSWS
jgi:hypothetical protein